MHNTGKHQIVEIVYEKGFPKIYKIFNNSTGVKLGYLASIIENYFSRDEIEQMVIKYERSQTIKYLLYI
jgi:hypothetical protein